MAGPIFSTSISECRATMLWSSPTCAVSIEAHQSEMFIPL